MKQIIKKNNTSIHNLILDFEMNKALHQLA